ncbi:MAG: chemotaxis protein CheW [Acidobacteria bacterium]|nr:chemotaxis protein CheW [Acidobacteriota bacterium]
MAHLKRFLVVRLAGREFAIPAARICGMMQMRGLQMEPAQGLGAARYLASLHGRALPVYIPNQSLGLADRPVSARSCLLLIRGKASPSQGFDTDAHAADCALVVDSISRLEDLPPNHCRPAADGHGSGTSHVRLGEKWREVLDVEQLLQQPLNPTT